MKQRPRTGFKQKNDDELMKVSIHEVEKYAELLYEDKYETKVKGARYLLFLITDPNNMVKIITENPIVIEILSRNLREEHKKNVELLLHLLTFFYALSYYEDFHQVFQDHSIGETCLNIVNFQFMKYSIRRDEILRASNKPDVQKEVDKFLFLVRKQDRILRLAFTILMHIAEDLRTEFKMVKKDIVGALCKNLDRYNVNLIVVILLFIKKLSIFHVNTEMLIQLKVTDQLMKLFEIQHPLVFLLTIQNIFNLSFDTRFRQTIVENKAYFKKIADCFKLQDFRGLVLRILYNLSLEEKAKPLFYDTDCLYILYELLYNFPEKIIGAELAALTLNLTTYPDNAKKLASNGRVKGLLERAFKNNDFELIKIVKNILKYSDDEDVNEIFEGFVDNHFIKFLSIKAEGNEFLIEVVEILSNIDTDWEEKIEKHKLIEFFEKHLKEAVDKNYDELLLAVILFLANISSNSECAPLIAKSKIIPLLHYNFDKKFDNYSIVFAIIYTLYQLMPWEDTRKEILAMPDLIRLILSCLKCDNSQIIYVSLNFLEIAQLYEPKLNEMIKRKKFKIYNKDFMNYLKIIQKKLGALQSINMNTMYKNKMRNNPLDEDDDDDQLYYEEDELNDDFYDQRHGQDIF